ncbi:hypothetical protein B0O99DRAFT_594838 [Bisporella sp. PMI_857]|nr:hypothetical protein B0O99DRAFT_594838 [Bisporella sp. PMI_857]
MKSSKEGAISRKLRLLEKGIGQAIPSSYGSLGRDEDLWSYRCNLGGYTVSHGMPAAYELPGLGALPYGSPDKYADIWRQKGDCNIPKHHPRHGSCKFKTEAEKWPQGIPFKNEKIMRAEQSSRIAFHKVEHYGFSRSGSLSERPCLLFLSW